MEGLTPHNTYLKNLKHQAKRLTSAGLSLITLLAEEANRLSREDEASRLKALYSSIRQQLGLAKRSEDAASYGHSQAGLIFSLGGLAASGIIGMVSKNKRRSATAGHLLQSLNNEQRPFGRVLVCIDPEGMPDDVRVVSISKLARESNQPESEVIQELQERGCLLFGEKEFSLLIDRLVDDVREGRLCLPISREKLFDITLQSKSKLGARKVE
jgi:hypothetical protein